MASPSGTLGLPWFTDFMHLAFWFFFFATFVVVIWLVGFHTATTLRLESRLPVRETRGFSRAQTGDALTAVLPLTWSITMLMHANTHSFNFDDNTAGAAFSLTVVAYQWGWNYYFPRDVVAALTAAPVLVGRAATEHFVPATHYQRLLLATREEYGLRFHASGQHVSRFSPYLTPLTAFVMPSSAPRERTPLAGPAVFAVHAAAEARNTWRARRAFSAANATATASLAAWNTARVSERRSALTATLLPAGA